MKVRYTRKTFADMEDKLRRMRRTDPVQFDVLYNDWARMREDADERRKA